LTVEARASMEHSVRARGLSLAHGRHGRGWLMRRLLLLADVLGLVVAFAITEVLYGSRGTPDSVSLLNEFVLFLATIPIWLLGAKLFGLYDRDEERADHSTADELVRVFLLASTGMFLVSRVTLLPRIADPDIVKLTAFWALLILCIPAARIAARTAARHSSAYVQRTVVVGAGDVGQLVARKIVQHPEYGLDLLGFVGAHPKERRPDLGDLAVLGASSELVDIVRDHKVDRVIFAYSNDSHSVYLDLIRTLRDAGVQVDIVPRLFDVIGPKIGIHTVEGLALVGLPPVRIGRTSRMLKRAMDVACSLVALVFTAPLFALIAVASKLDSRGPVLFRQHRLGKDLHDFTVLKFRTMRTDADDGEHRAYIAATMGPDALPSGHGLYKLDRSGDVTRVGRWLRKTSLDELPQLINVLRGDMSLVGPRPCMEYELEHFEPHHFDRFLVPAGLTGLWQVSARAHSPFGEALDLDVLYAHSWSLSLDLSLLARTPLQLLRTGTA
jgi:exopolysaccharide biosynthesis polyprenyl glycosylphosphotransferase